MSKESHLHYIKFVTRLNSLFLHFASDDILGTYWALRRRIADMQLKLILCRVTDAVVVQAWRPIKRELDRTSLFVFFVVVDCTQKRVKDVVSFLRPASPPLSFTAPPSNLRTSTASLPSFNGPPPCRRPLVIIASTATMGRLCMPVVFA